MKEQGILERLKELTAEKHKEIRKFKTEILTKRLNNLRKLTGNDIIAESFPKVLERLYKCGYQEIISKNGEIHAGKDKITEVFAEEMNEVLLSEYTENPTRN